MASAQLGLSHAGGGNGCVERWPITTHDKSVPDRAVKMIMTLLRAMLSINAATTCLLAAQFRDAGFQPTLGMTGLASQLTHRGLLGIVLPFLRFAGVSGVGQNLKYFVEVLLRFLGASGALGRQSQAGQQFTTNMLG